MALASLQDVTIGFGGPLVLDNVQFQIQRGERVCLLGRNGSGKTTLLKLIQGDVQPDKGSVSRQQGISVALLAQEVPGGITGTVFDVVMSGLGERGKLMADFHHLSVELADSGSDDLLKQLDQLHKRMDAENAWETHRQAETAITRMSLDAEALFQSLSSGMKRRVLMARALVSHPDLLLLDEPTNHLDIDAIAWLEEFLLKYGGTLLFVTHDRVLVRKLSTRIVEMDRGRMFNWNCDYQQYLERKSAALEAEQNQWGLFDKKLAQEEVWIRQGIKARRTRNEGRVKALLKMREERRVRRVQMGTARISLQEARRSGKLVVETEKVSFSYTDDSPVIRDFSTLIMRGDRVGIIGPNGSGKTTLLRLLLGELTPRQGDIRLGTNLQVVYFDQLRKQLNEERTVQYNVADGNDRIIIDGNTRHVISYLQEFLFTPDRARTPVKVLSGGERNRLLLAKLFARPSNLLVMDEPTNDLDMETLELLEEVLLNYSGTLLLVSHDRAFLNNVVTSTLVLEGEGRVGDYIGGYDDWLAQRPAPKQEVIEKPKPEKSVKPVARSRKLSNKERHELESLPQRIEDLEVQQQELYDAMADPGFYKQDGKTIAGVQEQSEEIKQQLSYAYQRWEELEELKSRYEAEKI